MNEEFFELLHNVHLKLQTNILVLLDVYVIAILILQTSSEDNESNAHGALCCHYSQPTSQEYKCRGGCMVAPGFCCSEDFHDSRSSQ
jgi:hypothetical protein